MVIAACCLVYRYICQQLLSLWHSRYPLRSQYVNPSYDLIAKSDIFGSLCFCLILFPHSSNSVQSHDYHACPKNSSSPLISVSMNFVRSMSNKVANLISQFFYVHNCVGMITKPRMTNKTLIYTIYSALLL